MARQFRYCECGRAIKVRKARGRHSHNWNTWKPTAAHDKCDRCWRAIQDRERAIGEEACHA